MRDRGMVNTRDNDELGAWCENWCTMKSSSYVDGPLHWRVLCDESDAVPESMLSPSPPDRRFLPLLLTSMTVLAFIPSRVESLQR